MKTLLVLPLTLTLASLAGCAVYPAYGYRGGGHVRVDPVVIVQPAPVLVRPAYRGGYYYRDHYRDRDGRSDRFDRDRDGDGVRNRYDSQPDNPWRR
ncbi:MAG: hypothetical protein ABI434_09410 [Burkholderiaceae bacterium]